jgi:hypothetical protein
LSINNITLHDLSDHFLQFLVALLEKVLNLLGGFFEFLFYRSNIFVDLLFLINFGFLMNEILVHVNFSDFFDSWVLETNYRWVEGLFFKVAITVVLLVIDVFVDGLVVVEEYLAIQSCVNVELFAHLSLIVSFQVVLSDFLHWSEYVAFVML